jgi:S-disulfanyl-L-cysteine oxidoreductase SoxD
VSPAIRQSIRALWLSLPLAIVTGAGCSTVPPTRPPIASEAAPAGLYTVAQAERGGIVFQTVCSACHGTAEFTGPIFQLTWMADPIGHFFEWISTTMPQDDPGSLTADSYTAVIAYIMRLNDRPPGPAELPSDAAGLARLRWDDPAPGGGSPPP